MNLDPLVCKYNRLPGLFVEHSALGQNSRGLKVSEFT